MHRSDPRADGPPYRLQSLLSPMPGMPSGLYFGAGSQFAVPDDGGMQVPAGHKLETDAYFNAFFLNVWLRWAKLGRVGVICRASGSFILEVLGHFAGSGARLLAECAMDGKADDQPLWIELPRTEMPARLSLRIRALSDVRLEDVAFVTDRPPFRPVRMAVGIVTHERERHLEQTVRALAGLEPETGALLRVIVVNQGGSFRGEGLRAVLDSPLFQVVEQANLGGCGGFARTMVEAMDASDRPTHLLLMDDDIVLDPRLLSRAAALAAHAMADVAIGGQAIELERPEILQEAWGMLGQNWLPQMIGANLDLTGPAALDFWKESPDVHYNGWWFCMIPTRALRNCGLPTPVFIRGDDIDYGLRLRAAAVPTVPLPGLGVWHASVRYKHVGLVQFYDLRNSLINAASNPSLADLPGPLHVLGWVMHHLLVHRYRAAAASLRAIADFRAGPATAMKLSGSARHRALSEELDRLPQPDRAGAGEDLSGMRRPAPFDAARSAPLTVVTTVWLVVRILIGGPSQRIGTLQIGSPDPRLIKGDAYLLALDPEARQSLVMRPRRLLFLKLMLRAIWVAGSYGIRRRASAARWRDSLPILRSRARWNWEFTQGRG